MVSVVLQTVAVAVDALEVGSVAVASGAQLAEDFPRPGLFEKLFREQREEPAFDFEGFCFTRRENQIVNEVLIRRRRGFDILPNDFDWPDLYRLLLHRKTLNGGVYDFFPRRATLSLWAADACRNQLLRFAP